MRVRRLWWQRATNPVDIPKFCWLMAIVLSIADRMVVGSGVVMAPTVPTEDGGGRRRG